uniref:FHA domain-containing protein n=2 Tax=Ornithorhynchus anatinus TaxID=9258 RepID=K7E8R3_ORNAN
MKSRDQKMTFGSVIVIRRDGTDGTCYPLTTTTCWFGRKTDCDIRIQLPQCSKEHCSIDINQDREAVLTNFSTVNPTLLNGVQVVKKVTLKHGDVLTIIDRSFRFEYPSGDHRRGRATRCPETKTVKEIRSRRSGDPDKTRDPKTPDAGEPQPRVGDGKEETPGRELGPIDNRRLPGEPARGSGEKEAGSQFGRLRVSLKQEIGATPRRRGSGDAGGTGYGAPAPASAEGPAGPRGRAKENRATPRRTGPPASPKVGGTPSRRRSSASKENEPDALSPPEREGSRAAPEIVGILKRKSEAQSIEQPPDPSGRGSVEHRAKRSPDRHAACTPKSQLPRGPRADTPRAAPGRASGERGGSAAEGEDPPASGRLAPADVRKAARPGEGEAAARESGDPTRPSGAEDADGREGGPRPGAPASEEVGARDPPGTPPAARGARSPAGGSRGSSSGEPGSPRAARRPAGTGREDSFSPNFKIRTTDSLPLPSKRKRVSFGRKLAPELFDKRLPPNSPLRRGATPIRLNAPVRLNTPVGVSARALIRKYGVEALSAKRGGRSSPRVPDACSPTPGPRRPDVGTPRGSPSGPKWLKSPYLQRVAAAPPPARPRTPKTPRSGGRGGGTRPRTPRSGVGGGGSRAGTPRSSQRRSWRLLVRKATLLGGFGLPSYADIVKMGLKQGQKFMVKRRVLKRNVRRKLKVTTKTPAKEVENPFSTGHANSPCTIKIGRAHLGKEPPKPVEASEESRVPKPEADQLKTDLVQPRTEAVENGQLGTRRIKDQRKSLKVLGRQRRSKASADSPYRACSGKPRRVNDPRTLLEKTDEAEGTVASSPSGILEKSEDLPNDNSQRKKSKKTASSVGSKLGAKSERAPPKKLEPAEALSAVKRLVRTPKVKAAPVEDLTGIQRLMRTPKRKKGPSQELVEDLTGLKRLMKTPKEKTYPVEDFVGVKRLMKTPKEKTEPVEDFVSVKRLMRTPKEKSESVEDLVGIQRLMRTPKEKAKPVEDLVGVKRLMRTPKEKSEPVEDHVGVKRLMRTPKEKSEPVEDLVGVKRLMRTPKEKSEPVEDLVGVKRLMRTPKEKSEPVEDLVGVKRLMRTPKEKSEPVEDLVGVKRLMRTPKEKSEPVEDLVGVKRIMRTPREKSEPVEDLVGVKRIMRTPREKSEPVEDLVGVKRIMRTPREKSEPVEDLVGISRLMRTPRQKAEPVEDFEGLRQLMRTPKEKAEPVEDFAGVKQLLKTPEPVGETTEDLGGLSGTPKAKEDQPAEQQESEERMDDLESLDGPREGKAEPGEGLPGLERPPRMPANETESRQPSALPDSQPEKPTPGKPALQDGRNAKPRGRSGENSSTAHSPQVTEDAGMQEDSTKKSIKKKRAPRANISVSEEIHPEESLDRTLRGRASSRSKSRSETEEERRLRSSSGESGPGTHSPTSSETESAGDDASAARLGRRRKGSEMREDGGSSELPAQTGAQSEEFAETSLVTGTEGHDPKLQRNAERRESGKQLISIDFVPERAEILFNQESSVVEASSLRGRVQFQLEEPGPLPRGRPANSEEVDGRGVSPGSRRGRLSAEGKAGPCFPSLTAKPSSRKSNGGREEILPEKLDASNGAASPPEGISRSYGTERGPADAREEISGCPTHTGGRMKSRLLEKRGEETATAETVTRKPLETRARASRAGREEPGALESVPGKSDPPSLISHWAMGDAQQLNRESAKPSPGPRARPPSGSPGRAASAAGAGAEAVPRGGRRPSTAGAEKGTGAPVRIAPHPPATPPSPERPASRLRRFGRKGAGVTGENGPAAARAVEAPAARTVAAPSRPTGSRRLRGKEPVSGESSAQEDYSGFFESSSSSSELPSSWETTEGSGDALPTASRPPKGPAPSRVTRSRRLRGKEPESSETSPPEEYSSSFEGSSELPSSRESSRETTEDSGNALPTAPRPPSGPAPSRTTRSRRLRGKEPDSSETSPPEENSSFFGTDGERPSSRETVTGSGDVPAAGPAPSRTTRSRRVLTRAAEVTVGPRARRKPGGSSQGDPGKDPAPEKTEASGTEAEMAAPPTALPKLSGSERAVRKTARSAAEPLPRAGNREQGGNARAAGAKAPGQEHLPLVAPARLTRARLKAETPDPHLEGEDPKKKPALAQGTSSSASLTRRSAPARKRCLRGTEDVTKKSKTGGEDGAVRRRGRNKKESLDDDPVPRMRTRQTRGKSN